MAFFTSSLSSSLHSSSSSTRISVHLRLTRPTFLNMAYFVSSLAFLLAIIGSSFALNSLFSGFRYPFPVSSDSNSFRCAISSHDESGDSTNGSRGMYFFFLYILPCISDSYSLRCAASPHDGSGDSSYGPIGPSFGDSTISPSGKPAGSSRVLRSLVLCSTSFVDLDLL